MYRRARHALLALILVLTAASLVPFSYAPAGDERPAASDGAPFGQVPAAHAQAGLPPLPARWPTTLQLGRANGPGGAAAMKAKAPFKFRYQYLSAGVNTGYGWQTWQENTAPPGLFATRYIQESVDQGMIPVLTYYMIYQSLPGGGSEPDAVLGNLNNTATMQAYWADLRVFFQKAGASPFTNTPVVFHVEPDMWGYVQQRATADNAATIPAKVNATGVSEVAGLPDNVAGLAQGIVRMRNQYAPNVILAYHTSIWGTNVDISMSDPTDSQVDALGNRAGAFYNSLGAAFDLSFGEFSDRDSAYMVLQQGKGPQSWWNADDFRRHARFIARFVATSGTRMALWQIPYGNTKMLAMNNTTHHYQDNRVEWLLDEPARTHLTAYVNAGAIGFFWGGGNGEVTDASDAANDGPPAADPAAINGNPFTPFGNTRASLNREDDGGYFHEQAAAYYTAGAMSLPAGAVQPPTATPTTGVPTATPTTGVPTATPTAPTVPAGAFVTSAGAAPASISPGSAATVTAAVTSGSARSVLVDIEVYAPNGTKVDQQWFDNQAFAAGQQRFFPITWNVPANAATGTYKVMVGIFPPGWGTGYDWNANAGTFAVTAGGQPAPTATPTLTPTLTPTATLPAMTCSPRPAVQLSSTATGGGLQVTVTASGANNRLLALQITETRNALVDVGGQTGRTGAFTVSLPGTSASTSFTIRRAGNGAATVRLGVVDRCGTWTTFVGGGMGAF